MRVLVCGGRDFANYDLVRQTLCDLDVTLLIEGGATGADRLAASWAARSGVHYARVPALWDSHGLSAGPMRNAVMLSLSPDLVVAFPGGRGTENMCQLAGKAGVRVMRVTHGAAGGQS